MTPILLQVDMKKKNEKKNNNKKHHERKHFYDEVKESSSVTTGLLLFPRLQLKNKAEGLTKDAASFTQTTPSTAAAKPMRKGGEKSCWRRKTSHPHRHVQ